MMVEEATSAVIFCNLPGELNFYLALISLPPNRNETRITTATFRYLSGVIV
jgi:hypothetical protein